MYSQYLKLYNRKDDYYSINCNVKCECQREGTTRDLGWLHPLNPFGEHKIRMETIQEHSVS